MVLLRLLVGIALVALALWIIVGEQLAGVTADATINARVAVVRAPIAGDLSMPDRSFGASVTRGQVLGAVEDRLVDAVRLDDLRMERAIAAAAVARQETLVGETSALIADLQDRADLFRENRLRDISLRLDFARERLRLLQEGVFPEVFDIAPPAAAGVERTAEPGAEGLRPLWINAVEERIAVLEIELESARAGVYLGDGYNDAPNSEQRIAELRSELASHRARLEEAEATLDAIGARVDAELLRTNRAGRADLLAPVAGQLWDVLAESGTNIQRGDPVLRVLDCGSVLVTASVTEGVYDDLAPGTAAAFRPTGDTRNFDATVIRLGGSGAATLYEHLAVAPSERHLERFDVTLSVPGLAAEPDLSCAVGRTGRVFFEERPLDRLRALWD